MRRRTLWIGGILLVAVALVAALGRGGARKEAESRYETALVESGRIVARVTASGTLSALVTVQVGSQVSGRIQALHADFNSAVHRGEILATIDPQIFEASVEQARANLSAAEGNLARSRAQAVDAARQYERAKALSEQERLIAQADLDTAEAGARAAEAQVQAMQGAVEQARASLHQAEINLGYTRIVSPIDGIVISRSVDVGQTVAASLQAPTLFSIAQDLKKMQVDTDVAEADVGKLRPGMQTTFTVDAYPAERFRGVVRQIRNAPQSLQNVVTYDTVIDVENPDLRLKPGMTANVTFVYAEKDGVLKVPNAALRFRPPQDLAAAPPPRGGPDQRTVWLLRDGRPRSVTIRVGLSDGSVSEALEGELKAGDPLIVEAVGQGSSSVPSAFRRPL